MNHNAKPTTALAPQATQNRYRYSMFATGKNWFEFRIYRNADNALVASGESRGREATCRCAEGDIARMERALMSQSA